MLGEFYHGNLREKERIRWETLERTWVEKAVEEAAEEKKAGAKTP